MREDPEIELLKIKKAQLDEDYGFRMTMAIIIAIVFIGTTITGFFKNLEKVPVKSSQQQTSSK